MPLLCCVSQTPEWEKTIPLQRVDQGDVISPKLFTTALVDALKTLNWRRRVYHSPSDNMEDLSTIKPPSGLKLEVVELDYLRQTVQFQSCRLSWAAFVQKATAHFFF
jgi:hypothetical protein